MAKSTAKSIKHYKNNQLTRIAEAIEQMDNNQARQAEVASIRAVGNSILIVLVIGQFLSGSIDIPAAIFGLFGYAAIYLLALRRSKGGGYS